MDAVKYFKELERLSLKDNDSFNKLGFVIEIEDKIKFVEEWSVAHPQKTRKDDFFEKHPNAVKGKNGNPDLCCIHLGYCKECEHPERDGCTN